MRAEPVTILHHIRPLLHAKTPYKVEVQIHIGLTTDQDFQHLALIKQIRGRNLGMARQLLLSQETLANDVPHPVVFE